MGRVRMVCRRFRALALDLTGCTLPTRRRKFCYHCLSTDDLVTGRYARHFNFPLCETCSQLPMHRALCESRLLAEFDLTRTDVDDRRVSYYLQNPRDRSYADMKMYLYTTGEDFARTKWGDAYVAALRDYSELVLNPYVDLSNRERRQHKRHLCLLMERGEAERLERKHQATLQRQADRKQRRTAVKALLKARGLRELADHPLVLDYGTNGVGDLGATVDVLGRGIALKAAFEALQLEPLSESITNPPAINRVLLPAPQTLRRDYVTMARAFVATGEFNGSAVTADEVAAAAQVQTERTSEVRALVAKVTAKGAVQPARDLLPSLNSAYACNLVTKQFLAIATNFIQHGPTAVASTGRREDALDALRVQAREAALSTSPASQTRRQAEIDAALQNAWKDGATADEQERFPHIFESLAHDKAMYVAYGEGPDHEHTLEGVRKTAKRLAAEYRARCEEEASELRQRADADEPVCWQIVDYTAVLPKTNDAWLMRFNSGIRPLDQSSRLVALDNFCSHTADDDVRRSDIPKVFRPFLGPRHDW